MDIIQKTIPALYTSKRLEAICMHYIHLNPLNINKIFLDLMIITKNYKLKIDYYYFYL